MAELAYVRFRRDASFRVVGFTVDRSHLADGRLCNLPVLPFDEVASHFPPVSTRMFIAVGPVQANRIRQQRYFQARELGYQFANHVSARAVLDDETSIGENCSIGENAVVAAFSRIGSNVVISSSCVIGHHCVVEDHCFLGVGCVLAGSVRVGARVFVGVNATIRDRVSLGEGCVIGTGATIVRDTAPGSVHVAPEAVVLPVGAERVGL